MTLAFHRLSDLIVERMINVPQWFDIIFRYSSAGRRTAAASDRVTAYIDKVNIIKGVTARKYSKVASLYDTLCNWFQT